MNQVNIKMPEPTTVGLAALDCISKQRWSCKPNTGSNRRVPWRSDLKAFTQKRIGNMGKIFSNAEKKLGDKLDRPGQVPPKVLNS